MPINKCGKMWIAFSCIGIMLNVVFLLKTEYRDDFQCTLDKQLSQVYYYKNEFRIQRHT